MSTGIELDLQLEELLGGDGPRVVAIGGGHGLAAALRAIRTYAGAVTAIVSVADDGGSSGRLTSGVGIPPPGDIRRCLLALAPERSIWSDLFEYRFEGGAADPASVEPTDVLGHSLGNLILAALSEIEGGFPQGVASAGRLLGAVGRVVPAADRALTLSAIIGGEVVRGQVRVARTPGGIERFEIGPAGVTANVEAVQAILEADQIVLGPGSLFTSVIAALGVPGIGGTVNRAGGRLVLVSNLVTQDAETLGMSGADHLAALRKHAGLERAGIAVCHRGPMVVPPGHDAVDIDDGEEGWSVEYADVLQHHADWPEHDPDALAGVLSRLV